MSPTHPTSPTVARPCSSRATSSSYTAQLDRLTGIIGMDTVHLGIVPLTATLKVPPGLCFWIYDDHQVVTETWHAELWLDDTDTLAHYQRTWKTLQESAAYGTDAHHLITTARRTLHPH